MRGIGQAVSMIVLMIAGFGFLISQNMQLRTRLRENGDAFRVAEETIAGLQAEKTRLVEELAATRIVRDQLATEKEALEGANVVLRQELQEARNEIERLFPLVANGVGEAQRQIAANPSPPDAMAGEPACPSLKDADQVLLSLAAGTLVLVFVMAGLAAAYPTKLHRRGKPLQGSGQGSSY